MGDGIGGQVCLEIVSVGPLFRVPDYRRLEVYLRRPEFFRHEPIPHSLLG